MYLLLVTESEFSGLHSVKSTEIFHFYAGDQTVAENLETFIAQSESDPYSRGWPE